MYEQCLKQQGWISLVANFREKFCCYNTRRKSNFESKDAHSSSSMSERTVSTTAFRMYKDWSWLEAHVLLSRVWLGVGQWDDGNRLKFRVPYVRQAQGHVSYLPASVKYWKEHGLCSLTDLDSNPSSVTYWLLLWAS